MIGIKEFQRFDLRVGEVVSAGGERARVSDGEREFSFEGLNVQEGDKVIVLVNGETPAVLCVGGEVVSPNGEAKPGMKIS